MRHFLSPIHLHLVEQDTLISIFQHQTKVGKRAYNSTVGKCISRLTL